MIAIKTLFASTKPSAIADCRGEFRELNGLHLQQTDNILALNPQLLCQHIDEKFTQWYNELLNFFFHRCRNKYSCFSKLQYNSSVLVLMTCSFKDILKDIALDFVLLVFKACCWSAWPIHGDLQWLNYFLSVRQKQSFRGVLRKRCSEIMLQIYRRTPKPKCDFYKAAKQFYWNYTLVRVFSCKFAAYFQNTFS